MWLKAIAGNYGYVDDVGRPGCARSTSANGSTSTVVSASRQQSARGAGPRLVIGSGMNGAGRGIRGTGGTTRPTSAHGVE